MQDLIGQQLRTPVHEHPNYILGIEGAQVRVATEGNPEGSLVSISLVQDAVDRIYADGEFIFDPKNRSAFLGAVLRTIEDIEVLVDPRRARLRERPPTEPLRATKFPAPRSRYGGTTYFMYGWDRGWRDYEAQGMGGEPLRHSASNNFDRLRAQVGDVVYVVANRDSRMILVGRMTIDHVVDQDEAELRLGMSLIERRAHVLSDAPDTVVRFDREVPEDVARGLRSETGARVKFVNDTEYRLAPQALMPMIRLTPDSARALDELLEAMPGSPTVGGGERKRAATSAALKSAIERRAIDVVVVQLTSEGWLVDDVGLLESYDLDCARDQQRMHVEVKGTTGGGEAVVLTANEVEHARANYPDVALAIVTRINVSLAGDGSITASGGELTMWMPWDIDDGDLEASVYRYQPPPA